MSNQWLEQLAVLVSDQPVETTADFSGMAGAVAAAMAKRLEEQREEAAEVITGRLAGVETAAIESRALLADLRKQEKAARKRNAAIHAGMQYFIETGNYLPLSVALTGDQSDGRDFCEDLGLPVPDEKDPAWKVPAAS